MGIKVKCCPPSDGISVTSEVGENSVITIPVGAPGARVHITQIWQQTHLLPTQGILTIESEGELCSGRSSQKPILSSAGTSTAPERADRRGCHHYFRGSSGIYKHTFSYLLHKRLTCRWYGADGQKTRLS